jgi:hypothetical protein
MAITISTALPANFAAFAPVVVIGETTRWPYVGTTRINQAITAMQDDGGKLLLKVADESGFAPMDTILVEGATGARAIYNGRHKLDDTAAGELTTTTAWSAVAAGGYGTAYRMNENLSIITNVRNVTDSATVGSVYTRVTDEKFSVDIGKVVQMALGSQFTIATGNKATEAALGSKAFKLTFDESFLAPDYSLTIATNQAAAIATGIGHRSADILNMIAPTTLASSRLPMQTYRAKDKIIFRVFVDEETEINEQLRAEFTPDQGSETTVTMTIAENNAMAVYQIPTGAKQITVSTYTCKADGTNATIVRNPFTVNVPNTCTGKRLYYLNHMGGWYCMEVHRYEDRTISKKVDRYTVESYTERTLYGVEEYEASGGYLADLVDSAEVYDENGAAVEVLSTELIYRDELVRPEVRIKIEKNIIC